MSCTGLQKENIRRESARAGKLLHKAADLCYPSASREKPTYLKGFYFAVKSQTLKVIIFRKNRLKVLPEIILRHLFLFSSWFFSSCLSMKPSSLPISLVVWVLHITDFCELALPTLDPVDFRDTGSSSSVALIDLGTRSSSSGWVVSDEIESNKHYLHGNC